MQTETEYGPRRVLLWKKCSLHCNIRTIKSYKLYLNNRLASLALDDVPAKERNLKFFCKDCWYHPDCSSIVKT